MTKSKRNAKGFSTVKTSQRLTRTQKATIDKELKTLVNDIKKDGREESLDKHIKKMQSITRGNLTRKKLPQKRLEIETARQKKIKELIGPKYNKTLKELNTNLLDKLLTQTIEKFNIEDEGVKDMLISSIIGTKYAEMNDKILNYILEIQKKIMEFIGKWLKHMNQIIIYNRAANLPPSSASEGEIEDIGQEMRNNILEIRNEIDKLKEKYNPILKINKHVIIEYKKIISLISLTPSENKIIYENFTKFINMNWEYLFDNSDLGHMASTILLEDKIREVKTEIPKLVEQIKKDFMQNILLLLNSSTREKLNIIDKEITDSFNIIQSEYGKLLTIKSRRTRR
jgi:hypothetical protein